MTDTIAIQDLRIGMFVHLDLGWMSHPFPRSSFRITSAEQIETLRTLGLTRVRWIPERSELAPADALLPAAIDATPSGPLESAGPAARARTVSPIERQHAESRRCAREYTEAGRVVRTLLRRAVAEPAQARADAEALAGRLLDGLRVEGELSIRLLDAPLADAMAAHAVNVAVLSLLLGRVFGLEDAEMTDLGVGALLHDVGHLELPERLRRFDERFTPDELQSYRSHVALGVAHGRRMGLSPGAMLVLAQHHEHADGSGFPLRLVSDRMSVGARIVALVDRFDRLCNAAPGARALTPHEALSTLFAQCRTRYDTTMLNAFIRMIGVYPAGSVVQLTDDRYALVVGVNSTRPLKPRVLVHDPGQRRADALLLNLEAMPDLGIRRSLPPAALPDDAVAWLAPPARVGCFFEPAPRADARQHEALAA